MTASTLTMANAMLSGDDDYRNMMNSNSSFDTSNMNMNQNAMVISSANETGTFQSGVCNDYIETPREAERRSRFCGAMQRIRFALPLSPMVLTRLFVCFSLKQSHAAKSRSTLRFLIITTKVCNTLSGYESKRHLVGPPRMSLMVSRLKTVKDRRCMLSHLTVLSVVQPWLLV